MAYCGELHADRTTANDEYVFRHATAEEDGVRVAHSRNVEGNICRMKRSGAGRDQDRFRPQLALPPIIPGDRQAAALIEPRCALEIVHVVLCDAFRCQLLQQLADCPCAFADDVEGDLWRR